MSQSFLKPYQLHMRTLSPLHIGSGKKLGRIEFVLRNQQVLVIDDTKLFNWIAAQPNAERLSFELADAIKRGELELFLKQNFSADLNQIAAYTIPARGKPQEIFSFIRTESHQPYLPGSSIKGALRSAILRGRMLEDAELRNYAVQVIQQEASQNRPRTNSSDDIQARVFIASDVSLGKWPNYDLNRLLAVRDSLAAIELQVMRVQVLSIDRKDGLSSKQKNLHDDPLELYIEAIPTGQVWQHQIVWQTQWLSLQARNLGFDRIEDTLVFLTEYCRAASQNLLEQEQDFYTRHHQRDLAAWFENVLKRLNKLDSNSLILPLGWGTGYDAKTITDLLDAKTYELVVNTYPYTYGLGKPKPGRNKYNRWLGALDSPKSRKVVVYPDDSLEPLGWVEAKIVAADPSASDWLSEARQRLASKKPAFPSLLPKAPARHEQSQVASPPPPAQKEQIRRDSPQKRPAKAPLVKSFRTVPKPGDRFEGVVFDVTADQILLEIPGLDADQTAYAVIPCANLPSWQKVKSGSRLTCKVIAVEQESESYWQVECETD